MNTMTVTVSSVTYAQKIKKLLEKRSIRSKLVKISGNSAKSGCTYGIRFETRHLYDVISILKENGMTYNVISERWNK